MVAMQSIAVDALKPDARNARTHSKRQIRQIADSITAFGFVVPIVIDEGNNIISGGGRYAAAVLLGLQEVPVVRVEGLSKAKRRALALADNKIAQNAGWDRELLASELPELAELLIVENLDISVTGFAPVEIIKSRLTSRTIRQTPLIPLIRNGPTRLRRAGVAISGNWASTASYAAMRATRMTSLACWGEHARQWRFLIRPTMSASVTLSVAAGSSTPNLPWHPASSRARVSSSSCSKAWQRRRQCLATTPFISCAWTGNI